MESYQDAFEAAWIEIKDAGITDMERRILINALQEGQLNVDELIRFARTLLIDEKLVVSLYVLYCGLHPSRWNEPSTTFKSNETKSSLLDDTVKYTLSGNYSIEIKERYLARAKAMARTKCIELFGDFIQLNIVEAAYKNDKLKFSSQQTTHEVVSEGEESASLPISPRSLTKNYIDMYC